LFELSGSSMFTSTNVTGPPQADPAATALQSSKDAETTVGGTPPPSGR
jgi:hypothetical protein